MDYMKLIMVSIIIATPIAWYMMNRWLEDFAYRIEISWQVFFWAGILALLVALATVSYQAIKSALVNPANSLRSE